MYVLKDALPALRKAAGRSATDPLRVLSLLDPWTQALWAQVASRYGEGWFFPLVKDGDLVGMAEIWEMSGAIEVREMDLASPDLLDEAIAALIRMMEFYSMRGVDVLRVTRFQGKAVPEAEDLSHWTRAGFLRFSDFLAHGPIVSQDFDPQDLVAFALTKQGVALGSAPSPSPLGPGPRPRRRSGSCTKASTCPATGTPATAPSRTSRSAGTMPAARSCGGSSGASG